MNDSVFVTGANGFIASALMERLLTDGHYAVRGGVRQSGSSISIPASLVVTGDIDSETDWTQALEGVSTVVHAAARVHVMDESSADPLSEFRRVNVDGTLALARKAIEMGVKRFIFLSSIKVNGEYTDPGRPFTVSDPQFPQDAYGVSKAEAEQQLRILEAETSLEVVIIRPVLVYGPGVKANFLTMMNWLQRGVPLPLGSIDNLRSLVSVDNLVDLIVTCLDHPNAAGEVFLVSDGEDLSTADLLRRMGKALGHSARLYPCPPGILTAGATILGKRGIAQRLCSNLQVDISHTCMRLGWRPPVSVDCALQRTAAAYIDK